MEQISVAGTVSYTLSECLGQGLSGCVYKAIRKDAGLHLEQEVTLKILNSENLVESWRREFESLLQVDSPFCRRLLGFDWLSGKPCLVLEYVDGLNLVELVERCHLSNSEIDEVTRQIQLGLTHLDKKKLFHGDLSPSNVLIASDGQVKLVDFGLGNVDGQEIRATPPFVAPEVYVHQTPSFAADLYSLGQLRRYMKGELHESHLRVETASSDLQDPFLCQDPSERRLCFYAQNDQAQMSLAAKVCEVQRKIRECQIRTQPLSEGSGTAATSLPAVQKTHRLWLQALSLALFLFLSLGSHSRVHSQAVQPTALPAQLMIRTHHWVQVWLDGKEIGYSPIHIKQVIPGKHNIRWRSLEGEGSRALTIGSGKNIVLDDSFFQ